MDESQEKMLDIQEAMERLHLGRAELYRKVKDGALKAEKANGALRFKEADVEKLGADLQNARTSFREFLDRRLNLYRGRLAQGGETELPDLKGKSEDELVGELCRCILTDGILQGVSEVHLDPLQAGDRLLYRFAGNLKEVDRLETPLSAAVKTKLKALAALAPAEGQIVPEKIFTHTYKDRPYQIRITQAPTLLGEHLHLHFYRAEDDLSLQALGYTPAQADALGQMLTGRPGLLLIAGAADPASDDHRLGLAAGLTAAGRLVVSLEHRMHCRSELLVQLELKTGEEAAFHALFQAALGMGPDVLMFDDVRSPEEAKALLEAASAGAVVLAQVRSSGSVDALLRLVEHGLGTSALARALLGMVDRVALRRLCPHCRRPRAVTPAWAVLLAVPPETEVHAPQGCERCGDGFLGRRMCYGVWPWSADLARRLPELAPLGPELARLRACNPLSAAAAAREAVLSGDVSPEDADFLLQQAPAPGPE